MRTANSSVILFAIASTILLLFLLAFIAALLFLYQKKNLLYIKEVEDITNRYEKNLLQTKLEIQEQTFLNISREIHDNIGLALTLAKLNLNTIDLNNIQKTSEDIKDSVQLITKSIIDLKDISQSLNSDIIENVGLYSIIKTEIDRINRHGKFTVDFKENGTAVHLDGQKELILFRIVQEALNNTLKHSQGSHVWVDLCYTENNLELSIRDDGAGFDKNSFENSNMNGHSGITNMQSRADVLNATLFIDTSPACGTTVSIKTPYK